MASEEENNETKESEPQDAGADAVVSGPSEISGPSEEVAFDGGAPAQLGTEKYVHAAFFAAGVLIAFLSGKILASIWNMLAEWPAAVRAVPAILRYAEDERPSYTMLVGGVIGIITVILAFRKPSIRRWADEVASELYKVHWPEREIVTNGTVVVLVAGVFATLYIGLLDRLWNFVTNLVYGI
jgi:preprotein translocase subunit SecE